MDQTQLKQLEKKYHISHDLLTHLLRYFEEQEIIKTLQMSPSNIQRTVRTNLHICSKEQIMQNLRAEGIEVKDLPSVNEGLIVTSGWKKLGSSQSYLSGEVMPQGLGSMLTVQALDPQPGEQILDMAAAPGGKSCFIAERMKGEGILVANDKSRKRATALVNNLARHGIENAVVTNVDGMKLDFRNSIGLFDRILLDAPCSGDGLIVSQPQRRRSKGPQHSFDMQRVQVSLIKKALSLLKKSGILLYATCSLSPVENEEVISSVLKRVKIEEIHIPGDPGFKELAPELEHARRLLPSKYSCDGFFICKMRKV